MDPNACLVLLRKAVSNGDRPWARELRESLRNWVDNGGYEPNDPTWRSA